MTLFMYLSTELLKKLLVPGGLITAEQFEQAVDLAQKKQQSLEDVLIEQDLIKDEQLGQLVADEYNYKFINLHKENIDNKVLNLIPQSIASQQKIIAFYQDEQKICLALAEPDNIETVSLARKLLGQQVEIYYATPRDINDALSKYFADITAVFADLIKMASTKEGGFDTKNISAVKIVDLILEYAYQKQASDIHIEPQDKEVMVRFRIDGILHEIVNFPKAIFDLVVSRIKILSELHTDEHAIAQDGKLRFQSGQTVIDIRVSVLPTINGEKIVMRLLSNKAKELSLEDLGFSSVDLKIINANYKKPYGMILSTGPTGCGKTTTLYSILKLLNKPEVNISTIEDPVEYNIEQVNQIQVNPNTGLTFAAGLRAILRQDPNIVMVGEIRDQETASIAVNAAMTGHLVLSTLHTNDAATALPRLINMDIEPFLIASTVNIIIAQRLCRKICSKCMVSYSVKNAELKKLLSDEAWSKLKNSSATTFRFYKGRGCPVCHNSGYQGRIGIFEILEMTDNVRALIMARANADVIKEQAIKNGMQTMIDDGVRKALNGLTTLDEVLRVAL